MAVAFDAVAYSGEFTNVTSFSWTHTPVSSAPSYVTVHVAFVDVSDPAQRISSVTYGSTSLVLSSGETYSEGIRSEMWRAAISVAGPQTVIVTFNQAHAPVAEGASLTYDGGGVAVDTDSNEGASGGQTNPDLTLTGSDSDGLCIAHVGVDTQFVITPDAGQTERATFINTGGSRRVSVSTKAGAASVTVGSTWAIPPDDPWFHGAILLVDAAEGIVGMPALPTPSPAGTSVPFPGVPFAPGGEDQGGMYPWYKSALDISSRLKNVRVI